MCYEKGMLLTCNEELLPYWRPVTAPTENATDLRRQKMPLQMLLICKEETKNAESTKSSAVTTTENATDLQGGDKECHCPTDDLRRVYYIHNHIAAE